MNITERTLQDNIPVMRILDKRPARNENSEDDSDNDDFDYLWKITLSLSPYVLAVLTLT